MTDADNKAKPIECCNKPLEFRVEEVKPWRVYKPETATCGDCNTSYDRKPGKDFAYRSVGESYICTRDGTQIMAAKVAHPIHDGPFENAGSGRCHYEEVPYCPGHEQKPSFHGVPIRVPMRGDGTLDASLLE